MLCRFQGQECCQFCRWSVGWSAALLNYHSITTILRTTTILSMGVLLGSNAAAVINCSICWKKGVADTVVMLLKIAPADNGRVHWFSIVQQQPCSNCLIIETANWHKKPAYVYTWNDVVSTRDNLNFKEALYQSTFLAYCSTFNTL